MLEKEIAYIKDKFSCTVKEGKLLYKLAQQSNGIIVEIGSWKGYSTIWLAKGSKLGNNNPIYAIDTFRGDIKKYVSGEEDTYTSFIRNINNIGVQDIIVSMKMESDIAEKYFYNVNIGLVFIDGDHDDVDNDFKRWYPHLNNGGIMALHDTIYWHDMKPYRVAVKELYKSEHFADVKRVGCITYGRKVELITKKQELFNKYSLYRRYIFQFLHPYYIKIQQIGEKVIKLVRNDKS